MTIVIDKPKALELLEAVVAERGADYIYPNAGSDCFYADRAEDGTYAPGCIIGHALARIGLPVTALHTLDKQNDPGIGTTSLPIWVDEDDAIRDNPMFRPVVVVLEEDYEVKITPDAQAVFAIAQREQDNGHTWGDALADAKNGEDD